MRSSGCRIFDLSNKIESIPLFVCFGPPAAKAEETGFYRLKHTWEEICQSEPTERIRSKLVFFCQNLGKAWRLK